MSNNETDEYPEIYIDDLGVHALICTPKEVLVGVKRYCEYLENPGRYEYRTHRKLTDEEIKKIRREPTYEDIANEVVNVYDHYYRTSIKDKFCKYEYCGSPVPTYAGFKFRDIIMNKYYSGLKKSVDELEKYDAWGRVKRYSPKIGKDVQVFSGVYAPKVITKKYEDEINRLKNVISEYEKKIEELTTPVNSDSLFSDVKLHIINAFKSYGGNWLMDAYDETRQQTVYNYIVHKFKDIEQDVLVELMKEALNELAEMNVKPYGE